MFRSIFRSRISNRSRKREAQFVEVPAKAAKVKSYATWRKDLASWIYRNQRLELLESPTLDVASNPGETERDFRVRLQQIASEQRDEAVEKLRRKYAPKFEQLEERKRRAEQAVERETEQAKGQKIQTAISFGATLLSSFLGRKTNERVNTRQGDDGCARCGPFNERSAGRRSRGRERGGDNAKACRP